MTFPNIQILPSPPNTGHTWNDNPVNNTGSPVTVTAPAKTDYTPLIIAGVVAAIIFLSSKK